MNEQLMGVIISISMYLLKGQVQNEMIFEDAKFLRFFFCVSLI